MAKRILLVDDNPDDVELTLLAFRRQGLDVEVVVARDGQEAVEYLFGAAGRAAPEAADLPSVVLLDLKMPRLGGLEVLKRIRADERTRHLPVVVLTSSTEERDLAESYRNAANSYVRKSVDFREFEEVSRHLGLYWTRLNVLPPQRVGT